LDKEEIRATQKNCRCKYGDAEMRDHWLKIPQQPVFAEPNGVKQLLLSILAFVRNSWRKRNVYQTIFCLHAAPP
jgi:hypothetical protein